MQQLSTEIDTQSKVSNIEHCSNCGLQMQGAYCSRCGQATRHFIKFFPSVLREIIEDTLDIDGRFGRTLATVIFKPGRATVDFLAGKRIHYTPPFRLYLFTSLLTFLLLNIELSHIGDDIDQEMEQARQESSENTNTQEQTETPQEVTGAEAILNRPEVITALEQLDDEVADELSDAIEQGLNITDDDGDSSGFNITFNNNGQWDPETNPADISWLPVSVNNFINNMIGNIQENGPRIEENPRLLIEKVIQLLPQTLFVLLPVFALILKCFYPLSKRFYMEHLIFSVHAHTFVLMIMIMITLLTTLNRYLPDTAVLISDITQVCLSLWILVYLYIAQKRVYRQGWFVSLIKYNLVYFAYFVLQVIAIALVIIIGAATL